jgi:pimeloyl-ACP methyl ester carboxylesterase
LNLALNGQLQTIASDTGHLCAYVKGQGRPLILVHTINASASAAEIRPLFESLSQQRTVYAIDLPGYGLSERADRLYTPRLMTDALHDLVQHIQAVHGTQAIDALAVSLSCEFLARAAAEQPTHFQTISLVSPTGFTGLKLRQAAEGQTYGLNWLLAVLKGPGWGPSIFKLLTKPKVIRYFLKKTWGSPDIDEEMYDYAVWTTQQPGAHHAPLSFLSAQLFSADITNIYDRLTHKVWMSHGTRGDFVDYRGKQRYASSENWRFTVYESGALPYFEMPDQFSADLLQFLRQA